MDDEGMIREIASEMLAMLGFEADEAANGEEVLEKYAVAVEAGQLYACVIMDLTIPGGMGGKETIEALLSRFPDAIAVVASGYSNDPVMADYAEYGFRGRLVKPFQVNQLRQELIRILTL
jgi:CheY-like chemotaxis protein